MREAHQERRPVNPKEQCYEANIKPHIAINAVSQSTLEVLFTLLSDSSGFLRKDGFYVQVSKSGITILKDDQPVRGPWKLQTKSGMKNKLSTIATSVTNNGICEPRSEMLTGIEYQLELMHS